MNNININNNIYNKNINDNEKYYKITTQGETDNNNEKKYINIIPGETDDGNNNNKNINIFKDNPFKNKENNEKKYQNEIPRPNVLENKNILNPFKKNIIINGGNKIDEEKKYINATPGQDSINNKININNPFQKKNCEKNEDNFEKNEIRLNDKKEEEPQKERFKIGAHFKKKFNKDFSKLSTLSSNSRHGEFDYSND